MPRELLYNKKITDPWKKYIANIDATLEQVSKKTIIFLGVVPYSRITLGLFLKNFTIFCNKYCKDIELMRQFMRIVCVEERFPKIVDRIQGTGYLLQHFTFGQFLARQKQPYTLLFYMITDHIEKGLQKLQVPFIGNLPDARKDVLVKSSFRQIVKELGLPHLDNWQLSREEFITLPYNKVREWFHGSFVVQRGDVDVGGEIATFFIHTPEDFAEVQRVFSNDIRFSQVEMNPFIEGNTYSMIGCATPKGVICGPLQLQLIDIPEAIRDFPGRGVFVGHDWGHRSWEPGTEEAATEITRGVGEYLLKNGYRGIFGIDLIYDSAANKIYPLECNPRFTGSFPMLSLLAMMHGLPPMDLLHVFAHEKIDAQYTKELFTDYQFKSPYSHILVMAHGIAKMPVDMPAGIYQFDEATQEVTFMRPALLPWEIQKENEFLVIDSVLPEGSSISAGATKLFKLIFPTSIAETSYKLKPHAATIVKIFSDLLYDNIDPRATTEFTEEQE